MEKLVEDGLVRSIGLSNFSWKEVRLCCFTHLVQALLANYEPRSGECASAGVCA